MKPFKIAAAGDSPEAQRPREGTSEHHPSQPAAAPNTPVVLSTLDAERLRARCLALISLCDELGIHTCAINLHRVARLSAWEVFPDAVERISEVTIAGRKFGTRLFSHGAHDVTLYTGDIEPDAIEGVIA